MPLNRDEITRLVELEADLQHVDPRLAVAVATQESNLRPDNPGDNGRSRGVFHLQERAAIDAGIDPKQRDDTAIGIFAGVKYLKQQLDKSGGHIPTALSRYNRGTPDYRGIGDPDYVYHVMRHYPDHPLGKAPDDQAAYRSRLNKTFGKGTVPEQPGILARVSNALSPARAEAAGLSPAERQRLEELEASLAEPQASPQATTPSPPTARSTPEQDAAYRASVGQQAPATAPQTAPAPTTQPAPSQTPPAPRPDPTATPGMRFQALPSITQLDLADRMQKTKLFESLKPEKQEEFLRSEEPAAGGLAVGGGPVAQSQPVTDPAALLAGGRRAPVASSPVPGPSGPPPNLDAELQAQLTPAQKGMPLLLGGAGAGALGRSAGAWAAGQLGRLGTALPIVGEGLANLGFRKGAVAAGMEEPGTAGDVAAVAAPAVLGLAAPVVAKVGNALKGVVKSASQPIVDLAERYGVRLSYGDVTKGAVIPKIESALEAVPGSGAGRMRVGQQADVTKAGETLRTGLQTEMQATPWRNLPALQRAAGQGNQQAQALLNEISAAGDDWGRVIQASGKLNLWQDRQRANQLYGRVEKLAQPLGNMPVKRTIDAMDNAVDDVTQAVLPSPELQREVSTLMSRVKTELTPTHAGAVPDTTYSRMKRLREDLGDMQRTATDPRTARYLGQVKTALQEDMREFAVTSKVPALVKAHKQADDFYRTRVVPYREGHLAKAIEKDLPDEIYGKFVRQGADRAQFFYKGLDQRGQAAVRYGMVDEAVKDAASAQHPDVFSPARFVASMRRIQDASGVFFKGAPQWEINGVTKLMQHAQRAGQYAENPPTGLRVGVGGLAIGAGVASLPTVLGTILSAQGLRTMLMTKTGRNFLLAASDMQPGSSAFQKRLDAFLQTLPVGAAGVGAVERAQEETAAR